MKLDELRIDGVRNLRDVHFVPGMTVNFLSGENGAGKTSCLEALHGLALGRSFRSGPRDAWLCRGEGAAEIFASGAGHRLGVRQGRGVWEGRIDGMDCHERARYSQLIPLFVFHPDAHSLVEGEPLHRRRLVDQGVFHVEPEFLSLWRRFRKALAQRNAALRARVPDNAIIPWESAVAEAGEALTELRARYVTLLGASLTALLERLEVRLPPLSLDLSPGWPRESGLGETFDRMRRSDRERGFTQAGPQRADLRIRDPDGRVTGRLSRGQQKLLALALVAAQAELFATSRGEPPLFLLDDVGSELDADHESRIGSWLVSNGWQIWMTGIERPPWLPVDEGTRLFHVEQGEVRSVT